MEADRRAVVEREILPQLRRTGGFAGSKVERPGEGPRYAVEEMTERKLIVWRV